MTSLLDQRRLRLEGFAAKVADENPKAFGGSLAISGIQAFPVREPVSQRRYVVIKVETVSGPAGFGEGAHITPEDISHASDAIRSRQATEIEFIRKKLAPMPHVRAAVNMALLDIVGKSAKAPVFQILGGPTRHKVRVLTRLEGSDDQALAGACRQLREAGFRAFTVPLPVPVPRQKRSAVLVIRRRLETLRAEAGEEIDFVLDGAGALGPGMAAGLSSELERFHLLWFDEPCAVSQRAALRKLAGRCVTPLGFGIDIRELRDFRDLLRDDAIDVFRPDFAVHGISEIRRMAAIAETQYLAVAPRHEGGPVATAAALHLAASLPNFFIQQIPLPQAERDRQMRAAITGADIETARDGFAALPSGPGLGITVDESVLGEWKDP